MLKYIPTLIFMFAFAVLPTKVSSISTIAKKTRYRTSSGPQGIPLETSRDSHRLRDAYDNSTQDLERALYNGLNPNLPITKNGFKPLHLAFGEKVHIVEIISSSQNTPSGVYKLEEHAKKLVKELSKAGYQATEKVEHINETLKHRPT